MNEVEKKVLGMSPEELAGMREDLSVHEAAHAAAYLYHGIGLRYVSIEGLEGDCGCEPTPVYPTSALDHVVIGLAGDYACQYQMEGECVPVPFTWIREHLDRVKEHCSDDHDLIVVFEYLEIAQRLETGATLEELYYEAEEQTIRLIENQWDAIYRLSRYLYELGYMTGEQAEHVLESA